jgi:hypothetical protein
MSEPLPTLPVHAIDPQPDGAQWLVQDLWGAAAVGVIGGAPKACKSTLALDLAVSVASATACLGRFEVHTPGPVLVYLAEDALPRIRDRVAQLCQHRGLSLPGLALHVITAPSLRLDLERDRRALQQTLTDLRPTLLILDPLVRLHRLDENSAADVSGLLGFLREINRHYQVALVLVHHMAKRSHRDLGHALRGSSDLYAWLDSACYLVRLADQRLRLTVEHRAAPAPDPLLLRLAGGNGEPLRLLIDNDHPPPSSLTEALRTQLLRAGRPLSRTTLRQQLRVNNARLGETLHSLEQRGLLVRSPQGWSLPAEHQFSQPDLIS